jgi:hypothetical protein
MGQPGEISTITIAALGTACCHNGREGKANLPTLCREKDEGLSYLEFVFGRFVAQVDADHQNRCLLLMPRVYVVICYRKRKSHFLGQKPTKSILMRHKTYFKIQ